METERKRRRDEASSVPIAVREAIQAFVPDAGTKVLPARPSETSFVYDWGVRVVTTTDEGSTAVWMCMASETCRTQRVKVLMSGGKTSKATYHLSKAHGIGSDKTASEVGRKRSREEELAILRRSPLFRDDPGRAYVLIETMRIVNNNLPFRIGEYEESLLIRDLMLKEEARVALNAKVIRHSVLELYDATKRQIMAMLTDHRVGSAKTFLHCRRLLDGVPDEHQVPRPAVVLPEFVLRVEVCTTGNPSLCPTVRGARWRNKGPLLPVGWRCPRRLWYDSPRPLRFNQRRRKRRQVDDDYRPEAELGVVHSALHARGNQGCIRYRCDSSTSKNPAMTDMLRRIVKTVYQTQHVEVMGTLFSELCSVMTNEDVNARQLLNFRVHRFLGLTRVVRRILLLWDPLRAWYAERTAKAQRENVVPPASFPLEGDKMELIQVLSLLEPISVLNKMGQSESGNQCQVLLTLYKIRVSLLDLTVPIRDCRSTRTEKRYFRPEELTNLASTTRALLHKAFHRVFFRRYTERQAMNNCSYAFEMQLLLHPNFKNPDGALKKVTVLSNLQEGASQQVAERHYAKIRRKVIDGVRHVTVEVDTQPSSPGIVAPPPDVVFSEDLMDLFAETADEVVPPPAERENTMHEQRIDEELDRWLTTPTSLRAVRPGELEPVLRFWKRQQKQGNFRLLPLVARVLFSMPSSSAQIERDFGTAGRMVTSQRSSLAPHNVDMATFLNCNRNYVDITQCPKLSPNTADERRPSNVMVQMVQDLDDEFGSLVNLFSSEAIDLGLSDNEDAP